MTIDSPLVPVSAAVFLLMLMRVGTTIMFVPGLGGRTVPMGVKMAFAVLLTVVLVPFTPPPASDFAEPARFIVALSQEFLVGLLMGFAVAVVFAAVEMAASLISFQLGLNLAPVFNPAFNRMSVPLDTFYLAIASLVFISANGHHILLLALHRSFETLPVGTAVLQPGADRTIVGLTGAMFVDALRIGMPVAGTLLIADAALGILSRMVPQMNVFFVGLPAKMLAGFFLIALTLPFLLRVMTTLMTSGLARTIATAGAVVK